MEIVFMNSYLRSIKKIKDKELLIDLNFAVENIETSINLTDVKNIKKMSDYNNFFRIKIGDYRLGIVNENNIIYLVQFEHRNDIYKKFP